MKTPPWVLPIIVISQFFCTSLWFAGNAVMQDIAGEHHVGQQFLAHVTSAVQLGFISGTFLFALLSIADRFSPSRVFFVSALLAAAFNLGVVIPGIDSVHLLVLRLLTGFFLAGVYPVGMKIASDYYREKLGRSLGFLVGALVLGTAFPHLLRSLTLSFSWRYVFYGTSILSVCGGLFVLLFLPDGPYRRAGGQLQVSAFLQGFREQHFRRVTFGYFGHMWELYTFWAFVPVILTTYNKHYPGAALHVPLLSFLIIASGSAACVTGGILSLRFGAKKVAAAALFLSCLCCIVSPLFLLAANASVLIAFLFFWAMVVIADSPLFSTLVAQNAPEQSRGTMLTIVNCIGFTITIISIQLLSAVSGTVGPQYLYEVLAIGPVLGLVGMSRKS